MVDVRVTNTGIEVLAESPARAAVTRMAAEVVADSTSTSEVRVTNVGVEVWAKSPAKPAITRMAAEVVADSTSTGEVRVTNFGAEVFAKLPVRAAVTRMAAEVVADSASTSELRVTNFGIEILAQAGVTPPIPLPFPTGIDLFMHNWATEVEMETRYETSISRSRKTGAEERRGLMERPERAITFRWLQQSPEIIDRLAVTLRRMTDDNIVLPLYQDMSLVTQDSSGTTLHVEASLRRYFNGARIAVIPVGQQFYLSADWETYSIDNPLADRLILNSSLSSTKLAGKVAVAPLIDCEILLEPEIEYYAQSNGNVVADLILTVREHKGENSLPGIGIGNPAGAPVQLGRPIFEFEPDFSSGVKTRYRRYGRETRKGRKLTVFREGTRYNQMQEFDLAHTTRQDFWEVLSFFDTRFGRLNAFWAIDREFVWTVLDTDPTFIEIEPQGEFSDFENIWTEQNIGAGFVFTDSTTPIIRQINTVQVLGGRWRLTLVLGQSMPTIDVTKIQRFAVARISRFEDDVLREVWKATEAGVRTRLATIEVQNEKEVDVDP